MRVLVLAFSILLAGCGGGGSGGGSGSGGTPTQENRAPTITSAAGASVPENSAGAVYQATATDADADRVTFRISGGDSARFAISDAGAVTFATAPDFEAPTDSNTDNVYQFQLIASDGKTESQLAVSITVTNLADQIGLRPLTGFTRPVAATSVPGTTQMFVAENGGAIYRTDPQASGPGTLYLTMTDILQNSTVNGVRSVVAAPDYATSGVVYAYVVTNQSMVEVRRYRRLANNTGNPAAEIVLRLPIERLGDYGGGMAFGPDGTLYVGTGRGTFSGNPGSLTTLLGKVLRLDLRGDAYPADANRNYAIPANNPFVGGGGLPEIFVYGVTDPGGFSFDGPNLYFAEDQSNEGVIGGRSHVVFRVRPEDAGRTLELVARPATPLPPIAVAAGSGLSRAATMVGGVIYRGPISRYAGLYIVADAFAANIYGIDPATFGPNRVLLPADSITEPGLVTRRSTGGRGSTDADAIATDSAGNLYLVASDLGTVFLVTMV